MMRNASHPCPVAGCGNVRLRRQVVCSTCWRKLPADLRDGVTRHRGREAAHLRARAGQVAAAWLVDQRERALRGAPG